MIDSQNSTSVVRFGAFEVDFQARELRKNGLRLRLEEKPFQILEMLIESAGHVVRRKALCDKLWPGIHVGFEHSLNTAVNKLRDRLGDSPLNTRYFETVPRVGYRFIAPVAKPGMTAAAVAKKMLLVLPFENLCGGAAEEYFADGLTEETTSQLGQLNPKRLGVIARTSASRYKTPKKSIGEIAEELRVDYVLEGSVRCGDRRVRITGQLIEARGQTHLWSASYNRELRDILEVQADVAQQIGNALAHELLA